MRMEMASTASPSTVHSACLVRNRYGWSERSSATTAEALYTITTLAQTTSKVEVKSTLSDLSFLATPAFRRGQHRETRALAPGSSVFGLWSSALVFRLRSSG